MAVKDAGPGLPQNGLHPVQHPPEGLPLRHPPQGSGRTGGRKSMQGIKRSSRVHSSSTSSRSPSWLILPMVSGHRAMWPKPWPSQVRITSLRGAEGCVQRLPTGALHQGAGVDHNPGGPHLTGHQAGGGDIADGLLQAVRVRVGQIDEIRGMEREGDPVLPGVLPYPPGGVLPHMDPLAALIFVAVQPLLRDPLGGGQGRTCGRRRKRRCCRRARIWHS